MAKIKVMHKAAVIETELTVKEIKRVEALAPNALSVRDEDKNVIFAVGTGSKESISKNGIVFAHDSKISVLIDTDKKVTRDLVETKFGSILLQLSKVEEQVDAVLEGFDTDLDSLIEITEDEDAEDTEETEEN